jgi:hypothetical protein
VGVKGQEGMKQSKESGSGSRLQERKATIDGKARKEQVAGASVVVVVSSGLARGAGRCCSQEARVARSDSPFPMRLPTAARDLILARSPRASAAPSEAVPRILTGWFRDDVSIDTIVLVVAALYALGALVAR